MKRTRSHCSGSRPPAGTAYNDRVTDRVLPVVAGLAYIECVRRLPSQFTATLQPEPQNRFNHRAVAILVNGEKVGYLPPELSRRYWRADNAAVECAGRRAPMSATEDTGVMILLDFSSCPPPAPPGDDAQ
jgi:hypothetical protein